MKKKPGKLIQKDPSEEMIAAIVHGIEEKKGKAIQVFDLRQTPNAVCAFFVICNADSGTQVDAIAYEVEHQVKIATGRSPWHSEGFENKEWILVDYADIVVHIFQTQVREFYQIEKLWADAIIREIPETAA
ncbi:MAG: ribosome silencing factor [Bacteroidia bacterium]|jgi:ribosome-associated protein|nr:ribosome silencing factor [Bacteroidia bacterium]MCC6768428.1 ribosome silencing factor [Bacteroidia bacterium]